MRKLLVAEATFFCPGSRTSAPYPSRQNSDNPALDCVSVPLVRLFEVADRRPGLPEPLVRVADRPWRLHPLTSPSCLRRRVELRR